MTKSRTIKNRSVVENIPATDYKVESNVVSRTIEYSWFDGPMPPPEILAHYPDDVQKTIISMAQEQMDHRHKLERDALTIANEESRNAAAFRRNGQYISCFLIFVAIIAAVVCAAIGASSVGCVLGGLAGGLGYLVAYKKKDDMERP